MKNDFPQYLTIFLSQYLPGQKNLSTNTIASYRDTFKLFLIFCEKEKRNFHLQHYLLSESGGIGRRARFRI